MHKCSLLFVLTIATTTIFAQVSIIGKVVDKENNPIEFVEVILLSPDTIGLKSQLADEKGQFVMEVEKGNYILQIQQMSRVLYFRNIEVNKDINLGIIEVENTFELDEVIILGKIKLVEQKIDRTVFNVENSSSRTEGDALGVLRMTPGVQVQNDLISMVGKSELLVMINDKLIDLKNEDLTNFLKSIPSDDIKNIEVITTPPAKYDAKGNSGFINIQLKRARKNSWSSSVGVSYMRNTYNSEGGRANFNFNKNNLSIGTSISYSRGAYFEKKKDYAHFEDGLWQTEAPLKSSHTRVNSRIDINYQINPKWSLGGQYIFNYADNHVVENNHTQVYKYETNDIIRSLKSLSLINENPVFHSVDCNTTMNLDTSGRKVTINLDYFNFSNPDKRNYNGMSLIQESFSENFYAGLNLLDQGIENYSVKIDLDFPTDWVTLSFGGKLSFSNSRNDISMYNSGIIDAPVTNFPLEENKFGYKENVEALYISAHKILNKKWEIKLGLRMENTQTSTFLKDTGIHVKRNYKKIFPTTYLSFKPNDKSTYILSYSRRISRPSFSILNPNLYFINPFQTIEGNAFLQPAFIDNIELTSTYRGLISKLYFSYADNMFFEVSIADPSTNTIRLAYENHITNYKYGVAEYYTFDEIKWWTSNSGINLNYTIAKSKLVSTEDKLTQFSASLFSFNDFRLNSKGTILLNISAWYRFPLLHRFIKYKAHADLSVGLQWLLFDKKLQLSIKGKDILRTQKVFRKSTVNGVFQEGAYYYDNRTLNVAISYRFGNSQLKVKHHKAGNEEEQGRTGN